MLVQPVEGKCLACYARDVGLNDGELSIRFLAEAGVLADKKHLLSADIVGEDDPSLLRAIVDLVILAYADISGNAGGIVEGVKNGAVHHF